MMSLSKEAKAWIIKNLPFLVLGSVFLCSFLAYGLGSQVTCWNSGGTYLLNHNVCSKIVVEKITICPVGGFANKWVIATAENITFNVTG